MNSRRCDNVEIAPSLSKRQGRGDYRVRSTVLVRAGGNGRSQECCEDVVALLFILREEAIFHQESLISPAVLHSRLIVHEIGRNADDDLHVLRRNQFQPFTAAVVFSCRSARMSLPKDVVPYLLLQSRRNGKHWSDPVRLFRLLFSHSLEIVVRSEEHTSELQ